MTQKAVRKEASELARLHTQVRAANALTAALRRSLLRHGNTKLGEHVRSQLARYDHSLGNLSNTDTALGIAEMQRDAILNPPAGMRAVSQVHDEIIFEHDPALRVNTKWKLKCFRMCFKAPCTAAGHTCKLPKHDSELHVCSCGYEWMDEIDLKKMPLGQMQEKCLRGPLTHSGIDLAEKVEFGLPAAPVDPLADRLSREMPYSATEVVAAARTCVNILSSNLAALDEAPDVTDERRKAASDLCKEGRVIAAIRLIWKGLDGTESNCSLRGAKLFVDSLRGL